MAGQYAKDTSVPVERSRAEIEIILKRYGASAFGYATDEATNKAVIAFRIVDTTGTHLSIRMTLPLPKIDEERFVKGWKGVKYKLAPPHAVQARWEQACRSAWRSLALVIKAKLEACAAGISTVEREFLADVVTPTGETIGQLMAPQLKAISEGGNVPRLLLGGAA